MLHCGILGVLALVVTAQVVGCSPAYKSSREKRQVTSPSFGFPSDGRNKETFFVFGDNRLVQLTGLDQTARVVRIGENDVVDCDLGTRSVESPSLPGATEDEVIQCANISLSSAGFELDVFSPDDVVQFSGPGQLYIGPGMVLFIADSVSVISSAIEGQRPSFPPVIPDLDIEIVRRGDQLVLNLDDVTARENVPPTSTRDALRLIGANCRDVEGPQSVIFRDNLLRVRQGLAEISMDPGIAELQSVFEQTIAGRKCLAVDRDANNRNGFLFGPGFLCVGGSGTDMDDMAAFFTNSTTVANMIEETLINEQLRCSAEGPSLVGNFTPNVDTVLVRLSEDVVYSYPQSSTIAKDPDANTVTITDMFGNVLRTFSCVSGVTLSMYILNSVTIHGPTDSLAPLPAPTGGGMTIENPDNCTVFAYPRRLTFLTEVIDNCRANTMATAPPPISFTSMSDALGGSIISANGVLVLTASTSMSFSVGAGQFVNYASDTVRIVNAGSTDPVNIFSGIRNFAANTAPNRLVTVSGSANNAFNGEGTLYVDSDGRAFFTNSDNVMNLIENSITRVPPQMVDIVSRMDGNMTVLSLQVGGIPFFNLPSQENSMNIGSNEGVSYLDGMLRVDVAMNIPSSSSLSYFASDDVLQISGSAGATNFTNIQNFFFGNAIDGSSMTIIMNQMFAGGGILYIGAPSNSAYYWPSNRVPTFPSVLQALNSFGVMSTAMPIPDVEMCTIYDGTRVQTFNGSALSLMTGPGLLSLSGNTCFFTNDQDLIQRIPEAFSLLMPPMTTYNGRTGIVSVVSNSGEPITNFSIGSRTLRAPDGQLMFDGGNITTSSVGNNFIASGITMLTIFDGYRMTIINAPDAINFTGGGLLVIDGVPGVTEVTAFYTTSDILADDIMDTIQGAIETFSDPDIPDTEPDEVTSKLNEINTGFGQLLTVYEGADINLQCNAGNANPPSTITFSTRSNFTGDHPFTAVMNSSDFMVVVNGVNDVTLIIPNIALGEVEVRCDASNLVGTASRTTRIKVRPQEPPVLDNFFFSGAAGPGEVVVTARTMGNVLVITPIVAPVVPRRPVIDDTSQLTDRVSIGCKASGRPKPDITWSVSQAGGVFVDVNISSPDANVTSRRQGQSILTVNLDNRNVVCFLYSCVAENGGGMAQGFAEVCPRRFDTEIGPSMFSDCSATCGIGVRTEVQAVRTSFNGSSTVGTTTADLPLGLVKPTVGFCPLNMECPVISFEFVVGEFSNCSSFCGAGNMTRDVDCMMTVDGTVSMVNDSDCTRQGVEKLGEVQSCDSGSCPAYLDNGFGPCSQTCKGGIRMRNLQCVLPVDGSFVNGMIVELEVCTNYSIQVSPVDTEECNFAVPCPVRYFPGPFGECDESFCQVRNVRCFNFDYSSDPLGLANDTECREQGLVPMTSVRSCDGGVCQFGVWNARATAMEECSEECGPGEVLQDVVCVNVTDPDGAVLEDGFCNEGLRPADKEPCFLRNCPGLCLDEPYVCPFIYKLRLCREARLAALTKDCCISCPLQASPIPPLPEIAEPPDDPEPVTGTP